MKKKDPNKLDLKETYSKPIKVKRKVGRPSDYTPEKGHEICFLLSTGMSLRTVCLREGMPDGVTVFKWMRDYPEFLKHYALAKQESSDAMAEDIQDIADETISVIKSGAEKKSSALAQAQRLRVDTRKWLMSKMKPKRYGDTIDVKSDGKAINGNTIIFKNFEDTNGTGGK